jgi:7-alpha-hydroxysteroid dehydrogenase
MLVVMILDLFKLDGKVAVVSGAGKGIGADIAVGLAEAGADVVAAARTQADIDETVRQIEARGRKGLSVPCDVKSEDQLGNLVAATLERFGRIDILINNAGGSVPAPAMTISGAEFDDIVHFNLTSAFLLTRLAVPHMVETAGGGVVVNISSGASVLDVAGMAPYGAAKAGLNQMTNILAHELAPKVRINAVIVGMIRTPGTEKTLGEELLAMTADNIPMGRLGDMRDISAGVLYLASPASSWVTGRVIDIGGGADTPPLRFPTPKL